MTMVTCPTPTPRRRKAATKAALDCASLFQNIGLDSVAAIKAHHTNACAGDAEAVHQIRVAITRLRAAVAFFAPIVVDAEWLRLKKEIAWLNGPLGAARDSDVVIEYARRKRYGAWAPRISGKQLAERQVSDHRRLVRCLRAVRTQRLIAALVRWIRQGPWLERYKRRKDAEALQSYCADQFNRWHERLVRKGRHLRTLDASRRHRLRIKVKRFRYMLEALAKSVDLGGQSEWRDLHGSAKRLQRALGDLRDLKRFADLADGPPEAGSGDRGKPPGYRHRKEKLFGDAIVAHSELEQAAVR
jgi:CHAD domain-containing protein